ncbi:olfactory receptor 2D2-like [Gracilinanus agilis]|uniref:olfactory receptor 2D2-like n=1 Tax=Gracilinanus agilis TaxID=191870 RepID=UPI001CFC5C48|nr:olfactory receptor 2D2-like [Gracilinanus agilis]
MNQNNQTWVTEFLLLGLSNDPQTQVLLFVLFLRVYMATVLGSLLFIYLVLTDSQLHIPMYFFLCNLSVADLCFSTNIVPQAMNHMLTRKKVISFMGCVAQLFLFLIFGATQCALLAVMSYDRYLAICDPMHYPIIMTRRMCSLLALGCWISGILISLVDTTFTLRLPFKGDNKIAHFFCEAPALLDVASADTHNSQMVIFLMGVVILLAPVSLILVSYGSIIVTVVRMKTTSGRLKAFSTCGSHLLVVILFYGSAIISYMTPKSSKEQAKLVSVFYAVINPMLNPLIYSLRNKDVKRAFRNATNRGKPGVDDISVEVCCHTVGPEPATTVVLVALNPEAVRGLDIWSERVYRESSAAQGELVLTGNSVAHMQLRVAVPGWTRMLVVDRRGAGALVALPKQRREHLQLQSTKGPSWVKTREQTKRAVTIFLPGPHHMGNTKTLQIPKVALKTA